MFVEKHNFIPCGLESYIALISPLWLSDSQSF